MKKKKEKTAGRECGERMWWSERAIQCLRERERERERGSERVVGWSGGGREGERASTSYSGGTRLTSRRSSSWSRVVIQWPGRPHSRVARGWVDGWMGGLFLLLLLLRHWPPLPGMAARAP
jgi:hypothetical protein